MTSDLARRGQSGPAKVEWFLRRDGSSFELVDVRVEGISMAITQRDEVASIIQRGGGQVAALLMARQSGWERRDNQDESWRPKRADDRGGIEDAQALLSWAADSGVMGDASQWHEASVRQRL